eukprot:TRINITY_DN14923_c0_g1_i1.p1 TRINITY_DN14923_c0_g1~~TRINITY_DN14923_c0_g1_i1.p1  ORF type:complete len:204 (+),score=10.31 TRINITY_DN14923_c0_g1_i1:32-643(+)
MLYLLILLLMSLIEKVRQQRYAQNRAIIRANITENEYDPTQAPSLSTFSVVMKNTHCLFAKKAKMWGSAPWNHEWSIEQNVEACFPAFLDFTERSREEHIDGFVIEVIGADYCTTLDQFSNTVRRVLAHLSAHDPCEDNVVNKPYIGHRGWRFCWNKQYLFITSFAPCYPDFHARYSFEAPHTSCFVLFQPEHSFSYHVLRCR